MKTSQLWGENGAGKSTFVKLLSRFYDVTSGTIEIDNRNIKDIKIDDWYEQLSLLTQDYMHYHFDAKTNIGIGDLSHKNDIDYIKKVSKLSGAHEFIKDYEHGYDQVLSKSFTDGISPSVGQWQKIAIARALMKDPQVLILDEPTSAIDPKAEYEIFENLFEYSSEKTVIIISHRFSTVRNASRIIVLDKGEIIEQGSHEELMDLNGKYRHAFNLQKKGYE